MVIQKHELYYDIFSIEDFFYKLEFEIFVGFSFS